MSLFEGSLRECTDDLCDAAARADDRPVVGREAEARQVEELLASRRSVLLVGEAGAGKSAVIQRVVTDAVARWTAGEAGALRVFRTSTSRLISDTKYLGEWQSKLTSVIRELEAYRHAVLYVTDIWNLTSVGRSESTDETMADLFKEFVESNRVILLGEATKAQIAAYFDRMPSFRNLLVQVRVDPSPGDLVRPILTRVAGSLAARANVAFDDAALDRIIDLTDRFLPYRHQPGKAIELFERALNRSVQETASDEPPSIDATVVEHAFAETTGLPMFVISDRERVTTDAIRQFFAERVLGQEHALDRIVETIALYKAGLNDPARPIGTFLFVGPTGVGKTELAKALAEFLFGSESRMLRFDMSEFKDYHSFEKLIGDPKRPGNGGLLVESMRAHPFAVVLLDEFEKAHANIADLFLQVFDDGRLTDAAGQTVDFRNAIIILTSNLGTDTRLESKAVHGFSGADATVDQAAEVRIRRALDDALRPEFINRIEHIVVFRSLTRETVRRIALRELGRVYGRRGIANRGIAIEVDDRLLDRVLDRGFNPKFGARALKRELSSEVVVPLAIAMMETAVEPGQILRLEPRGERATTVRVIDTEESLRAATVDEEVSIEGRRLSLSEVADGAHALAARIASVAAEHDFDTLESRIDAIRERQATDGYWTDQTSALADFSEYNKLVGKVRLVRELQARLAEIESRSRDAVRRKDASARESLVREFVRAELACDRFEVELTTFDEYDDAPALVTLRVQGATPSDIDWLDTLADQYVAWARAVGRPFEVLSDRAVDGTGADPISVIRIDGPFAFGYLKGEAGIHRMRDVATIEGGKRAVSAVARVEVWPLNAESDAAGPVEFVTAARVRASGSRLARLRSCVVARSGDHLLHLQNGRTVDENRTLAAEILPLAGAAVGRDATQAVRTYHVSGRRKIRDPRSGLAVSGRAVDTYLAGGVDAFLRRNAVALKQLEIE